MRINPILFTKGLPNFKTLSWALQWQWTALIEAPNWCVRRCGGVLVQRPINPGSYSKIDFCWKKTIRATATHKHNLILGKMIFEVRSHVCKLPDNYVLGIMISIEQWNIRNYLRIFQPWLISFRLRDYFKEQAKLLFRNLRSNHFLKFKIILLLIFWSCTLV